MLILLIVDFHGEITSEKMAMGHFFDGFSTALLEHILMYLLQIQEY